MKQVIKTGLALLALFAFTPLFSQDCPGGDDFYAAAVEGCGNWVFEIGSFVEGEEVLWNFGDETTEEGGHFADHSYEENGVYLVTAVYTSPLCPDGAEFIFTVEVSCYEDDCEAELYGEGLEDCGAYIFEIPGFGDVEGIMWYFGDDTEETAGHVADHYYAENGTYEVCAFSKRLNVQKEVLPARP